MDIEIEVAAFVDGPIERARTRCLRALWHAARGDWNAAHEEAQAGKDNDCAWVHAMLHRDEGDQFNAAYWYRRAEKPVFRGPIQHEREMMIATLLRAQL